MHRDLHGHPLIVDLFAGAGGWDLAALQLGLDPIGIEHDRDACATRGAARLRTIRATLGPAGFQAHISYLDGLIASPPCPAFSVAGRGGGRDDIPVIVEMLDGGYWDRLPPYPIGDIGYISPDGWLTVEPLAWIEQCKPTWIAMEQVPAVLPIWQAVARWLQRLGWYAWAGKLCAADYGVPQERYRAILLAHRDRPVCAPDPTHSEVPQGTLFGPERERWVTMADALDLVGPLSQHVGRTNDHGDPYRPARRTNRPSPTIMSRANRWEWGPRTPRPKRWPTAGRTPRRLPAPTVAGSAIDNWVFKRPATTVQGDARIWPPGHKINQADMDRLGPARARARYGDRAGTDAIRVEPWQAAVLQSFPDDYPFQGPKSSQARQIGNAIPPLLAFHLLSSLQ